MDSEHDKLLDSIRDIWLVGLRFAVATIAKTYEAFCSANSKKGLSTSQQHSIPLNGLKTTPATQEKKPSRTVDHTHRWSKLGFSFYRTDFMSALEKV